MGFVGASPLHNPFANWIGAALGVGAVVVWTRWLGQSTACDVGSVTNRREHRDEVDAAPRDES